MTAPLSFFVCAALGAIPVAVGFLLGYQAGSRVQGFSCPKNCQNVNKVVKAVSHVLDDIMDLQDVVSDLGAKLDNRIKAEKEIDAAIFKGIDL